MRHNTLNLKLIAEWLPITKLSEESTRERRSMTVLPPLALRPDGHFHADIAGAVLDEAHFADKPLDSGGTGG